jgi:hypothetical protein
MVYCFAACDGLHHREAAIKLFLPPGGSSWDAAVSEGAFYEVSRLGVCERGGE